MSPGTGTTSFRIRSLRLDSGIFTGPSGYMGIYNDGGYKPIDYNGGTIDLSSTNVNVGGKTQCSTSYAVIEGVSSMTVNDLTVNLTDTSCNGFTQNRFRVADQPLNVLGNFRIINGNFDTGTINLSGNLDLECAIPASSEQCTRGGNGILNFVGTSDQRIQIESGVNIPDGTLTVNKPSGSIIQEANVILDGAGQDLNIIDGAWNMAGYNLTVNDQLNIGDGVGIASSAKVIENCGVISSGSLAVNPTDGEILSSSSNPSISISDSSVVEGGNLEFTINLSEGVCSGDTNITYTTDDGTATIANSDYTDNDSTLVIPSGSTSATITVVTTADSTMEPDETVTMNLVSTDQGTITDAQGIGTIENDDDNGYIWTGDAGDNEWSTDGNWSGGFAPPTDGSANILFNDLCVDIPANCNANISSSINVNNVWLDSNYSGTITQGGGAVVETNIFTQSAGDFVGTSGGMDFAEFNLFGGNFTATSDTLRVGPYFGFHVNNSDGFVITDGTFLHNNGTVHFNCRTQSATWDTYNCLVIDVNNSVTLNNLEVTAFDTDGRSGYNQIFVSVASGDTIVVEGNYTVHDGAIRGNGNVELKGNAIFNCADGASGVSCASASHDQRSNLIFSGSSPQTYAFAPEASSGSITINSTSTLSPSNPSQNAMFKSMNLQNGTFNAPSAKLVLGRKNRYFQNANNEGLIISGGTFNHNSGTVEFAGGVKQASGPSLRSFLVDVAGSLDLNNLIINVTEPDSRNGYERSYVEISTGDSINVLGDFTIDDGAFIGGNGISVYGNVTLNCTDAEVCADSSYQGALLTFKGSVDQTISMANASGMSGSIIVDKTSGKVTQLTDIILGTTGADLTVVDGTWLMNGNNLSINDQLNIGDGVGGASTAVLSQDCQTATSASTTVNPTDGALTGSSSNPDITISDTSTVEGGNLNFTVTLSEGVCSSSTNITFTTDDDSALLADSDYIDNDNTLTLLAGDLTGSITVSTTSDDKVESNETLNINLTSTDQGTITDSLGVGTITNDDACPTGFVAVDGNTTLKTETFCVMQFEARDNAGTPESTDSGTPWVSINASDAKSACDSMSEVGYTGTFSLISNPEWMTIARDIENNSTNWSGSAVGSGHIPRGHSDNSPSSILGISDSADAYTDTLNSSGDTPGSGWEQARVHTLANNSQIWDLAGNAREWTDWNGGDSGFTVGPTDESSSWQELGVANIGSLSANDYRPFNASYDSTNSFGQWFGGTNGAAIRGGGFSDDGGVSAGVFTLNLSEAQSYTSSGLGFRCVYREQQPPTAHDFSPSNLTQDTESIITLQYGDYNGDLALSCSVSSLSNVTESTGCSCDVAGVCTVGITGTASYTGPASFEFNVTDNDGTSKEAAASLTISP